MATASNIGVKPDHIIIWCDKNRAVEGDNIPERKLLENNADLNHSPLDEADVEINRLILDINLDLNQTRFHRLIRSPLRMLKDENECIKCIHDSIAAGKQPFLITSGQTGAVVLPQLREESTDRLLQQLRGHTYLFCAQIELHSLWTGPYEKDIEIYDDEKGVFAKVLLDIGGHYFRKCQNATGNDAAQYFRWACRLVMNATEVDGRNRDDFLTWMQSEVPHLNAPTGNDDDDYVATEAADQY